MPQVAGDRRYLAKTGCAALWTCATASAGASLGLVRLSDDHHQRGMRDPIAPSLPHLIDGLRSAMIIFSETSRIATAPRSRTFAIGGVFWPYGILFTFVRGGAVEYQIAGNLEDEDIVMRHILMRHIVSITAFVVVLVLIGFGSRDNGGASGAQLDDSKTAAGKEQPSHRGSTGQEKPAVTAEKCITNSIRMKLVLIPAGEFMMGSRESAAGAAAMFNKIYGVDFLTAAHFEDEQPRHRVRITRPFYLGMYHVTRRQFRRFVADTGYKTDAEKGAKPGAYGWIPEEKRFGFNEKYCWRDAGFEQTDEHPVVNVSWNDAVAFCKWLSRKEGKTYRLPTEAEWEYACRAGTTTRYYNGDDPEALVKVGNVADATLKAKLPYWKYTIQAADGHAFTAPVASFLPNTFGLYDMHGNAWQWCADWYGSDYYAVSSSDDPNGPSWGDSRVLRGGSWDSGPIDTRSANRFWLAPGYRFDYTGFRVARTQ